MSARPTTAPAALVDPGTGIAFGYVTDQVPSPGGADRRAVALAEAVRRIGLRLA